MASITTLTAGHIAAGDTVVMPCGGTLEVARWELFAPGEVALFSATGERWLVATATEVGIVGDVAHRDR